MHQVSWYDPFILLAGVALATYCLRLTWTTYKLGSPRFAPYTSVMNGVHAFNHGRGGISHDVYESGFIRPGIRYNKSQGRIELTASTTPRLWENIWKRW